LEPTSKLFVSLFPSCFIVLVSYIVFRKFRHLFCSQDCVTYARMSPSKSSANLSLNTTPFHPLKHDVQPSKYTFKLHPTLKTKENTTSITNPLPHALQRRNHPPTRNLPPLPLPGHLPLHGALLLSRRPLRFHPRSPLPYPPPPLRLRPTATGTSRCQEALGTKHAKRQCSKQHY